MSASASSFSLSTAPRRTSMIETTIDAAAAIIMKWDAEASAYAGVTSLFYESKSEAMQFIKSVNQLQEIMHFLVSHQDSDPEKLTQAQRLMQIAMKRLQKEFYQILSMNRADLDPESVSTRSSRTSRRTSTSDYDDDGSPDDEIRTVGDSISDGEDVSSMAMSDLKLIADCMIASGYAKECIQIYKTIRKSIIDEGIYKLGIEKLSSSQVNKMEWEILDLKIKNWLQAEKISLRTLFSGERILCDYVFASSDSIRESCFAEISKGATLLFEFPELVAKTKKSPAEKMFRVLDMYTAISDDWQEIETIFAFQSTSAVRLQALNSMVRLSESVLSLLTDFESTIQNNSSKAVIPGGGLHRLTIYSMNYLTLLADYGNILTDIISDWPPSARTSLPEPFFDSPDSDDSPAPAISVRIAWLILVLLCKLDGKSKYYKDVSLSYLFLANNIQHVLAGVRTSNLLYILGEEWIAKHEAKVRQFAANYERLAWGKVFDSLPENPTASMTCGEARECFRKFNISFEDAYLKQSSSVVPDPKLQNEIKVSIGKKLVAVYREFHDTHKSTVGDESGASLFVRFSPEVVDNYVSELFSVTINSESSSTSSSTSSRHRRDMRSPVRV
ncbi:hypothetical protein V6N12_035794 [Hibiscus sabdariffa]|uniref:Exocyst subunit Exo70 family protein n=1 Tax=Hibiscus sabdariffa TaxID=183260 RepID=A0ABR2ENR2_9ROSI